MGGIKELAKKITKKEQVVNISEEREVWSSEPDMWSYFSRASASESSVKNRGNIWADTCSGPNKKDKDGGLGNGSVRKMLTVQTK